MSDWLYCQDCGQVAGYLTTYETGRGRAVVPVPHIHVADREVTGDGLEPNA